ncbi:hypothetical protein AVEN_42193-1 [Araneus ventricosus]|uniref:Uncharacterized protein n=1 Tax=Araneus ventricosus TaxID=182803 RepID=A0A4Y2B1I4_ARAVE|nr:hypothetical protein AVEN_42193-1 [Araneus ventricosus]
MITKRPRRTFQAPLTSMSSISVVLVLTSVLLPGPEYKWFHFCPSRTNQNHTSLDMPSLTDSGATTPNELLTLDCEGCLRYRILRSLQECRVHSRQGRV